MTADLDSTAPVFVGKTAARFLGHQGTGPGGGVTLHDRHDPCGHVDPDAALPTFVGFVADALDDRVVDASPCGFCGDAIPETPPVPERADGGVEAAAADAEPAWTPGAGDGGSEGTGPTRECLNCGAQVSKRYVDVHEPDGVDRPRCCPECPDLIRDGNGVREKRG